MQLGSIWGHGAYQAPDWTADWLHRELTAWLDLAARDQYGKDYAALDAPRRPRCAQLKAEYRGNSSTPPAGAGVRPPREGHCADGRLLQPPVLRCARAAKEPRELRHEGKHAAQRERRAQLTHFFFWTAWAAATERPGHATYTNNWPHEPLIDNAHSGERGLVDRQRGGAAGRRGLSGLGWAFLRARTSPCRRRHATR
jgi:nitric oxide reductase subunit B